MNSVVSSKLRKIVITGTNRGVGKAILQKMCQDGLMNDSLIISTARNKTLGEETLKSIKQNYPSYSNNLTFHQLDITDKESISNFKKYIIENYKQIDVLINNAGIALFESGDEENLLEIINTTFQVNLDGQINLTETLLDLINTDGGHIINISSGYGQLKLNENNSKLKELLDIENMTDEKFNNLKMSFLESSKNHTWEHDGWLNGQKKNNGYAISKAFLNLYTRMLDRRLKSKGVNIKVNSCSPGHCQTDMGGPNAPKTALEGADTVVWLASFPPEKDESLSGNYYRDRTLSPYYIN